MSSATLAFSAALSLFAGALYAYVGRIVARRMVSDEARTASRLFVVWWYALAGLSFLGAGLTAVAAAGGRDLALYVAFTHMSVLVVCGALWALLYYLVYLFTGSGRWFWPLTAFYAIVYASLELLIVHARPVAVDVSPWNARLEYASEPSSTLGLVYLALLIVPQFLSAVAYFMLYFRLRDPAQRYRVGMVSLALIGWFGSSIVAGALGLGEAEAWPLMSRFIGVAASIAILLAYQPPAWVRRRIAVPDGGAA